MRHRFSSDIPLPAEVMESYSNARLYSSSYIMCVAIISLLVGIVGTWSFSKGIERQAWDVTMAVHNQGGLGEELNGLVPEFDRHEQVFWNDSSYGPHKYRDDLDEDDVQALLDKWHQLLPPGLGFVPIRDHETHTLPPALRWDLGDEPVPGASWYSMSVFHQLHCLDGILKAYLNDRDKLPWATPHPMAHDEPHVFHCIDYLRQAIMCCGDTALEGADVFKQADGTDTFSQGTLGVGSTHVCKKYDAIYQYSEENGLIKSLETHLE